MREEDAEEMVEIQEQEWLRPQLKGISFLFFKLDASNMSLKYPSTPENSIP